MVEVGGGRLMEQLFLRFVMNPFQLVAYEGGGVGIVSFQSGGVVHR